MSGFYQKFIRAFRVTADEFVGALTGAVTGNVTGNLTGNVTGDVTGNVTGNVTGDLDGGIASGATKAEINRAADVSARIVNVTSASVTITEATHEGKVVTLNRAGGITVTLPAATGGGGRYKFVVGTTFTSNGVIQVVGNDIMTGMAIVAQDGGDTSVLFETAADSDTITFNGTTTGGLAGADVELNDIATDTWHCIVRTAATGAEATPFSAAV